jgi:hypothetical protein
MRSKVILAGVLVAAALALSACGPEDSTATPAGGTGTENAANPAGGGGGGGGTSGHDSCLMGTWKVDVPDMARQAAAKMASLNATGTGTGDITVVFADQMTITYNNSVGINAPMSSGLSMDMTFTYTGSATSTEWQARDGKLSGVMPTNGVKVDIVTTIGGQSVPSQFPFQGALDLSQGVLDYTCGGNTASFTNPAVTWHLTKA